MNMKKKRFLSMLVLLMTAVTGAWAGTKPDGRFDQHIAQHGSLLVRGWTYDPDQPEVSLQVEVKIWHGTSASGSHMPAVVIDTDVERSDVNSSKGITGIHGFERYITVPAGTYTVEIYAIDITGDENQKLPMNGSTSATVTVEAPYNITYDANGGSGAPDAQQKGENVQLTLSSTVPTRTGYTFAGWNTASDGSGTAYAPRAIYMANADLTLYAQWTQNIYKVSVKEGTEYATSWQGKAGEGNYLALPLTGLEAGTAVTGKYNGTKKVKSVKAKKKVKPAATVTTAPTAKSGVKAGQYEAIVNAGTAEGGTMMYMVNATQPASTDGFSATVPTAQTLAAGTYYVWYYVEGDASHTDSEISATGIAVTIGGTTLQGQRSSYETVEDNWE